MAYKYDFGNVDILELILRYFANVHDVVEQYQVKWCPDVAFSGLEIKGSIVTNLG